MRNKLKLAAAIVALIGPQLRWDWSPGSSLVCKYQHEMSVRNRPQGERFWIEVSVPFK